jgi:hypothetical protein
MHMTRATLLLTAGVLLAGCANLQRINEKTLVRARQRATWRSRQLVFNNDGDDHILAKDASIEGFLANRSNALEGSQVSTIVYCTSRPFGMFTHNTKVGQVLTQRLINSRRNIVADLIEQGTDPLRAMVGFCRKNDIEILWSMRMNDTHDSGHHPDRPHFYFSNFKREHPECLLGTRGRRPKIGAWNAVDYGAELVRDTVFRVFEEICTDYDVDGIEMDFYRHLVYFRSVAQGGVATDADRQAMTELVRRTRRMMDAVSIDRQRPLLLTVRVPDSVAYCRTIGLDVEQWLAAGLVDIMVAGGDFRLSPWSDSIALGRRHGVPVWCDLDPAPRCRGGGDLNRNGIRATRGRAAAAWQAGASAVYYFNWFNPTHAMWRETGDAKLLKTMPKLYFANVTGRTGYLNAGSGLLDWSRFDQRTQPHPGTPRRFALDAPLSFDIELGEEAPQTTAWLHVLAVGSGCEASLNGVRLQAATAGDYWQRFAVPGNLLRAGTNNCQLRTLPSTEQGSDDGEWTLRAPAAVFGGPGRRDELFRFDPGRQGTVRELRGDALLIADRSEERGSYLYCSHGWAADPAKPCVVEVDVQVLSGRNGLIIANGRTEERIWLYPDRIQAEFAKAERRIDLTGTFHTVRAEIDGQDLRVSVDGKELITGPGALTRPATGGRNTFLFGASMSGTVGEALWRGVRYRTGSEGAPVYDVVLEVTP